MTSHTNFNKIKPSLLRRRGVKTLNLETTASELPRLSAHVCNPKGRFQIACSFDWNTTETRMTLEISGEVSLTCMRCLDTFKQVWTSESVFEIYALDQWPTEDEGPFEGIELAYDGTFDLYDVVMDELLLGLPERHPSECPQALSHYINET